MVTTSPPAQDLTVALLDLDGEADLAAYTAIDNAANRCDAPWEPVWTPRMTAGFLRHGWDLEPPAAYLARSGDGTPVASGTYETSGYDNHHLAWLGVSVHPEHRRQGHGSAVLDTMVQRARAEGRSSVGANGWDNAAPRGFAARHGLEVRATAIARRQDLAEVDPDELDRRFAEARPRAAAYDVVRYPYPTPEADLADVAVMVAAINDAPTDDLDIEDQAFPPERVRAFETAHARRDIRLHRVVARHRGTGHFAGQTIVAVDPECSAHAEQYDTSVVAAHRGHRLGLLLKVEMLRLLAEREPQARALDTWNAESNDHMIAVNEQLGYRVLARALEVQRSLSREP